MSAPTAAPSATPPRRASRARQLARNGFRLALSVGIGLVLLEGALRFLLFSEIDYVSKLAWRLRRESLYTMNASAEYWKLSALWSGRQGEVVHPRFDPLVGWRSKFVDPGSYRHVDEARIGERRPILLYGDSYARCVTPPGDCWEGLLERSGLGDRYLMLNYASGGYGLDQIALMLEQSVDLYADQDPIVIVAVLVDDDLDRCYLPLRVHPKPRFSAEGDALVLHRPERLSPRSYVEQHPIGIRSYLWRRVLFGMSVFEPEWCLAWIGEEDHLAVKTELNTRILERIRHVLESRGLSHFFVLFHARRALKAPDASFWNTFLERELGRLEIPFVSSMLPLIADMDRSGRSVDDYFVNEGVGLNHYTATTNAIVFEALRQGLRDTVDGEHDGF